MLDGAPVIYAFDIIWYLPSYKLEGTFTDLVCCYYPILPPSPPPVVCRMFIVF